MLLGLSKIELGIVILLLIYILGNFSTPVRIMHTFKTPYPGILMFLLLGYLFVYSNPIILLMYVFSLYELMRRSDMEEYDREDAIADEYGDEVHQLGADDYGVPLQEGFDDGDDFASIAEEIEEDADKRDGLEDFQNEDVPLILETPSDPLPEDGQDNGMAYDNQKELLQRMVQESAVKNLKQQAMEDAEVIEEFTSLLGKDSLETGLIDKMSPVGTGSVIKYKSTPYKPLGTNLTGASLI